MVAVALCLGWEHKKQINVLKEHSCKRQTLSIDKWGLALYFGLIQFILFTPLEFVHSTLTC